jgi:hypothetical protein
MLADFEIALDRKLSDIFGGGLLQVRFGLQLLSDVSIDVQ